MRRQQILLLLLFISTSLFFPSLKAQNVSLNFDGNDDYVQTTYPGIMGSADRTFEAWVYVGLNATTTSNMAIVDYGLNAVGSRNTFGVGGDRSLRYLSGGTNANIASPANVVPVAQWTHVAFVLDNGTGFLYVNGVQVGTGSLTTVNTPSGNEDLKIGQRVVGGSILFEGSIDEVRIFDYARTATQITAEMNSEYCSIPSGLIAYYRLNDGIALGANSINTVAVDESGNNNAGTLNNFSLTGATSNWVNGPVITSGATSSSIVESTCSAYTSPSGNYTWTSTGVYTDIIPNMSGCDSIIAIDLTVTPIVNAYTETVCDSLVSPSGNYTWSAAGIYHDTVQTVAGCDSILIITLGIGASYPNINPVACDSYTSPSGNNTWTTSGVYQEMFTTVLGCDSIQTINLTINSSSSSAINEMICQNNYTSPSGDFVWNTSGVYQDIVMNTEGCDSVITINLDFIVEVGVSQNQNILTSNENDPAATYQWINCEDNLPIPGETNQVFTAVENGSYAVTVSLDNCTLTSDCFDVTTVTVEEVDLSSEFLVYPNPTQGRFTINLSENFENGSIEIVDIGGRVIFRVSEINQNSIEVDFDLKPGSYVVMVLGSDNKLQKKRLIVL